MTFRIKEDCVPCVKKYTLSFHKGGGVTGDGKNSPRYLDGESYRWKDHLWSGHTGAGQDLINPPSNLTLNPSLTKRKAELVPNKSGPPALSLLTSMIMARWTAILFRLCERYAGSIKQMFTTKPVSISVRIDLKRQNRNWLIGENLGSILLIQPWWLWTPVKKLLPIWPPMNRRMPWCGLSKKPVSPSETQ